jgi:ABC-type branched-subunit amino acid transport system substrate-binding protein
MIKPHRNPYIIGRPIDEREFLVGRESLFRFIEHNLRCGEQLILLHGQRRIGKSSLIRNVPKIVGLAGFVFVPFDLEYHSQEPLSSILAALSQEIVEHLEQLGVERIKPPELQELESEPYIFYSKFLPQVYQELGDKNLVLLLDEFDALNSEDSELLIEQFFTFLSSIIELENKLFIIPFLGRQSADMPNLLRIFKNAPTSEIGLLDEQSTYTLITEPAEGVLDYELDAKQAIFKLSAGHPYFTQVICFAIFGRAREQEKWQVSAEDVGAIVDSAIELAEAGLAWFWDGLSCSEKVVFSAVAEAQKIAIEQDKSIPQDPLIILKDFGVTVDNKLTQAVKQLVETELLDKPGRKVKIELVRRWILQRHPLRQEISLLEKFPQKKNNYNYEIKPKFANQIQVEKSKIERDRLTFYRNGLDRNSHELHNLNMEIPYQNNSFALTSYEIGHQKPNNWLLTIAGIIKYKSRSSFLRVIALGTAISTTIVGISVYRLSTPCSASEKKEFGIFCVADPSVNISRGDRTFFLTNGNINRDRGIEAFKNNNYTQAGELFKEAVVSDRKDPEVLIYYNNARASQKGSPVTLAVSIPGDNSKAIAEEILRGVAQAQNQFNENDGLNGKLLEVVVANDGNEPEQAKQVAQVFVNDSSILGVIGYSSSNTTQAALAEYQKANLPLISPSSTSNSLTGNVFFRTIPSDAAMGKSLAEYAKNSLGIKKVVIFYATNSDDSKSIKEAFENNFQRLGGRVQKQVDWSQIDYNSDLRSQLSTIVSQTQAEGFVLFPSTDDTSKALEVGKTSSKLGLKLLGGDAFYSDRTLRKGSESLEGLIVAVPWFREAPKSKKFTQAALKQWGGYVSWRTASSYDATQAFIKTLTSISPNFSRQNTLRGLRQVNLSPSETSGEYLKFTADGERQSQSVLIQAKGGKFTLVP